MKDLRGVDHDACNNCGECDDFIGKMRCDYCDCAAAKQGWSATLYNNMIRYWFGIHIISIGYDFIPNYMNRYTLSAFPLVELGVYIKPPSYTSLPQNY